MAKYCGYIGFAEDYEDTSDPNKPSVWKRRIVKKKYYGDITRNTRKYVPADSQINSNLTISNDISIVSDPYANLNFHKIIYVEFMGTKWKINNCEVQYPRLILHVGDIYNDEEETEDEQTEST